MSIIYINPFQFAAAPSPGGFLLDDYPNAAAAYSLRQLRTGVTNVVSVRRDNDDTEQDFTATQVSDGTLVAWVGAGNNGFVQTWYDQSGNSNDVSADLQNNQPRIVESGVLVTENSNPAISYSNDLLSGNCPLASTSNYAIATVYRVDTQVDANPRYFAINAASSGINLQLGHNTSDRYFNRVDSSTTITTNSYSTLGSTNLLWWGASAGVLAFSRNGQPDAFNTSGVPAGDSTIGDGLFIFKGFREASFYSNTGKIQELIVYPSDQSSNRVAIEANINAHYNIYP
jgi:hypothetical protein